MVVELGERRPIHQFWDEIISERQECSRSRRSHAHCDRGSPLHALTRRDRLRGLQLSFRREAGGWQERFHQESHQT